MLPCLVRSAKIRHAALIDNANLVKMLVQRLSSLVDGNDGSRVEDVGRYAQGFDKLESSAGVETSSRANRKSATSPRVMWNKDVLIPSPNTTPRGHSLSNRHTLLLSATHSPNGSITNRSVQSMP